LNSNRRTPRPSIRKRPDQVQNRDIVVLDDVVTSGASLIYARDYLLDAGADSVSCVAIAKAIGNQ
jgi:predicted amidophosphoribosyltransferase